MTLPDPDTTKPDPELQKELIDDFLSGASVYDLEFLRDQDDSAVVDYAYVDGYLDIYRESS